MLIETDGARAEDVEDVLRVLGFSYLPSMLTD